MEGDSKTKGMVQAPTINNKARKIHAPPKIIRVLRVKTVEEFMGFAFISNPDIL
jgi:hypothetical protein